MSRLGRSITRNCLRLQVTGNTCTTRRWKVSSVIEPPLDCQVLEKPCTILLMEDKGLYESSWLETFKTRIPLELGMSFAELTFPQRQTFGGFVEELKSDISPITDAVLVARGPISSWCAQVYLESLALQGLVMVDPILFDDQASSDAIRVFEDYCSRHNALEDWNRLFVGAKSKTLRLEPGSVPMLVLQTLKEPSCAWAALAVAKRHSDNEGPYGEVSLREVPPDDAIVAKTIDDWIGEIL